MGEPVKEKHCSDDEFDGLRGHNLIIQENRKGCGLSEEEILNAIQTVIGT